MAAEGAEELQGGVGVSDLSQHNATHQRFPRPGQLARTGSAQPGAGNASLIISSAPQCHQTTALPVQVAREFGRTNSADIESIHKPAEQHRYLYCASQLDTLLFLLRSEV